ncbi:MAG TPA: bifunctional pyr operon transcriptional regulator/uracil phosphoribosyltransferase PyrR [Acidimicrobiia bacterium]|jgi:pyrimidine operon attenuation protein/uracil phosphoribosyltransferase
MDEADVGRAIKRIAHEMLERHRGADGLILLGVHTRGVPLASALAAAVSELGEPVPVGEIDIGPYRDDLGRRPTTRLGRTSLPVDPNDRTVVLVDDVLFTGRTIRAALDAVSDLGRPASIELAVLVDRGHRQLPIRPDYIGKNLPTSLDERVTVKVGAVDGDTGVWVERAL